MTKTDRGLVHTPFFLQGSAGKLFALHLQSADGAAAEKGVLFFPPFAEEMNKSRRMVSLQARRMAASGYQVLLVDLYGTGDSEGDFEDARWEIWRDDMRSAAGWMAEQGVRSCCLWGLRLGTLLAVEIEAELQSLVNGLLLWQPVLKGETYLTQFLRLRIASEMMTGGVPLTTQKLRDTFGAGEAIEIAGYTLHPDLAKSIDAASADIALTQIAAPVGCFQVTVGGTPNAIAKRLLQAREAGGLRTDVEAMPGEQFWQSAEIAVVDELLERSSTWLGSSL